MKRTTFLLLTLLSAAAFAQNESPAFDGQTVTWPANERLVMLDTPDDAWDVFSAGSFTLPASADSVRIRFADIDTWLLAPWRQPGHPTGLPDGVYDVLGVRIGAAVTPFLVPGLYILVVDGKPIRIAKPH